jgi:hypothetical protein
MYASIPAVPQQGIPEWQFQFMNSVKQNLELLAAQRGDTGYQALIKGQLGVFPADELSMTQVTAVGAGFTISGQNVAGLEDYSKLLVDVQKLANDVGYLREVVNTLIAQLKR